MHDNKAAADTTMYVKTATVKVRCNAKHRGCVHGSRISILRYGGIAAVNENVCICMYDSTQLRTCNLQR